MFADNPTPDRSAEILSNATGRAAEIQMQGYQSLGNSLASMGDSFAKAYTKASENKMTSDYLDGLAGQFSEIKRPNGQPYMDAETLEKFSKAPLGKKQGIVSSLQAQADYDMKRWMYDKQYNAQNNRVNANMLAQQPAPNQVPMSTNTVPAAQTQANPAPAPAQDWRSMVPKR
jgi:hypothetical protein